MYADTVKIVQRHGGVVLEQQYVNSRSPLLVECSAGHRWRPNRDSLKNGDWCPQCAGRGRTREDLVAVAKSRGGDLVSKSFSVMSAKYRWRCKLGHEWNATANNIVHHGRWCPTCGRNQSDAARRRYYLADLQQWAKCQGGKCLATEFSSVVDLVPWECECGHIWEAEARRIRDGGWCPECAKRKRGAKRRVHTSATLKQFAQKKGGKCYPPEHFDVKTSIEWECSLGHRWRANADNVVNGGKWCPDCAGTKPLTLTEMRELAKSRHGDCLSKQYVNSQTPLDWVCSAGHVWSAVPSSIKAGRWCPTCSAGLGERICREHFEQLLDAKFPKSRPPWLRSEQGNQLELDGYSADLALAFEHQGTHHYKKVDRFHETDRQFETQVARDEEKKQLCVLHGVDLVEVPSVLEMLGISEIAQFISNELGRLGRLVPAGMLEPKIDYSEAYKVDEIAVLQDVARERGGELLSTTYLGIFEKLTWRCSKGHEFDAAPNNVKNSGSWCPRCIGRGQGIADMKEIAAQRGGDCLSTEYLGSKVPLIWKCAEGHVWEASPQNVKFSTWCPTCAKKQRGLKRRKYDIASLQRAAARNGGSCESSEYLGYKINHRWRCSCGAEFDQTPERVLRGVSWCPHCKTAV